MVQLVVNMAVTFLMAPFYLSMMGHHDYGLREMVLALIGYMGMLDLGMRPTVSRFASMHNAQEDRKMLLVVYATSLVFLMLVGALLAIFFWLWAAYYPQILAPTGGEEKKYTLFLLIIGAQLLFAFPRFAMESYLEGLQHYYLKNMINIGSTILLSVLAYLLMTPENALVLFTFLVACFALMRLFIFMALLWRPAFGLIYPNLRLFSWAKLKEMLQFGLKSFIQGTAQVVENMTDRLVIGAIAGPAAVPIYSIPATLVNYSRAIVNTLTHVFMPLFSDLSARGKEEDIRKIYLFASKIVVGVVVPVSVGISLVGGPFIEIWMDGQFDQATVEAIIVLLAIYVSVPLLNPFASRYLTAINRHGIFARIAPIGAFANLILSVWFVYEFGPVGAALGSVFPVFFVTPVFLKAACRRLKVSMRRYVRQCMLPSIGPVLLMAAVVVGLRMEWGLTNYGQVIAAILAGAFVYAVAFWWLALKSEERVWLLGILKRH